MSPPHHLFFQITPFSLVHENKHLKIHLLTKLFVRVRSVLKVHYFYLDVTSHVCMILLIQIWRTF